MPPIWSDIDIGAYYLELNEDIFGVVLSVRMNADSVLSLILSDIEAGIGFGDKFFKGVFLKFLGA